MENLTQEDIARASAFANKYRNTHNYSIHSSLYKDMENRWSRRTVKNGWDTMGEEGAKNYLNKYGKGIQDTKLIHLAIFAEKKNKTEYANYLWHKAMEINTINAIINAPL